MKIFCDTEWSNVEGDALLSVGLVAEDGRWCYVELPKHPQSTPFVQQVVWPLLKGEPYRCERPEAKERIKAFLKQVGATCVFSDFFNDVYLLEDLLEGRPVGVQLVHRREQMLLNAYEEVFAKHPWAKEERHNALIDAFALRSAYYHVYEKKELEISFGYPFDEQALQE